MDGWMWVFVIGSLLTIGLLAVVFIKLSQLHRRSESDSGLGLLQAQVSDLRTELQRSLVDSQERLSSRLENLSTRMDDKLGQGVHTMNQRLTDMTAQIDRRLEQDTHNLQDTARLTHERLDGAARAVGDVTKRLAELSESNRRIFDVGKNIEELQDILRAPKLRGVLGELFLGEILAQTLPAEHFTLQYAFRNRETVDAIVRLDQGILSVDAKFPLENFRRLLAAPDEEQIKLRKEFLRDVKKHIDAIAKKYIRPDEGTLDFAFMYIPAENVYYETILKPENQADSLVAYAMERRVIPVSPNSFYAYLQVVLMGIRGLKIEENARQILDTFGRLQVEYDKIMNDVRLVGRHLGNAVKSHESVNHRLERFGARLDSQRNLNTNDNGEKQEEADS